jgi:hypothetical protein
MKTIEKKPEAMSLNIRDAVNKRGKNNLSLRGRLILGNHHPSKGLIIQGTHHPKDTSSK